MVITIQQGETVYPIYILYRVIHFFANKVKSVMALFNIYISIIRGLLELVPPMAITIGMKEMLAAKEIHIYLLRKWHSGIMRRCFFGEISPKVPSTFLQEHPNKKVFMPEYVAEKPVVVTRLDI